MAGLRLLDLLLLGILLLSPWALLAGALFPFREILARDRRVLLLLGTGLVFFQGLLFSPFTETLNQGPALPVLEPWLQTYRYSVLREGRAPLWLDHLGIGLPALANPYTGFTSPFTSLVLFFADLDHAVGVLQVVHLTFLGLSGFVLARSVGLSRAPAVVVALALVVNPWVFRRLNPEGYLAYLFAAAWLPLAWALALRAARRGSFLDAARAGIPLSFMAVSMATVFAVTGPAVAFALASPVVGALRRRNWRTAGRALACVFVLGAGAFLAGAPEHLAARELLSLGGSEGARFSLGRIRGWRDRDLSTPEFVRVLLPNELGRALLPGRPNVSFFGVPFSPGDAVVALAALGFVWAFAARERRDRLRPGAHLVLFLLLGSVATHGLAYEPILRLFPYWATSGNWPSLGLPLLLALSLFGGVGTEAVGLGLRRLGAVRRLPRVAVVTAVVLFLLLTTEMFFGLGQVRKILAGTEDDHRLDLRFSIGRLPITHFERMPHLAALAALARDRPFPPRVACVGDKGTWPSPCFDFLVGRYRLAAVGPPEFHWALPAVMWDTLRPFWNAWQNERPLLFTRLLQLAGVEFLVSTRPLPDRPLVREVRWDPFPGESRLWEQFLSSVGGGPWVEPWDGVLRIQEFPQPAPRAFFARAVLLTGRGTDSAARKILGRADVHHRKLVLLHEDRRGRPPVGIPSLPSDSAGAPAREEFLRAYPGRENPVPNVRTDIRRLAAGSWEVELTAPTAGALFFSQLYYPGMRATVNGRRAPVYRADLFFSAVPVPAGPARVVVRYAPLGIYGASLLTLGFTVFLILRRRR